VKPQQVKDIVVATFKEKPSFAAIGLDDDYFDLGVSSLTIVGLQIAIEEKLRVAIETRELMRFSTINQWIDAYVRQAKQPLENA
jgi:acyl carrier protein